MGDVERYSVHEVQQHVSATSASGKVAGKGSGKGSGEGSGESSGTARRGMKILPVNSLRGASQLMPPQIKGTKRQKWV